MPMGAKPSRSPRMPCPMRRHRREVRGATASRHRGRAGGPSSRPAAPGRVRDERLDSRDQSRAWLATASKIRDKPGIIHCTPSEGRRPHVGLPQISVDLDQYGHRLLLVIPCVRSRSVP
ncbi:hypothetical protein SPHINGOT1_70070 [Sphingomonas sp. T1]|nr:hypothetical protein SPHINGOT1_70070 [Sphingomonas sp. T1]